MVDRRNRVLWTIIALLLLAAGVAGLLTANGVFGDGLRTTPILPDSVNDAVGKVARGLALGVTAVVGLLLALLGWRLVRPQFLRGGGRHDVSDLPVHDGSGGRGRTVVRGTALAKAVERDMSRLHGVDKALVGLYRERGTAELRTSLDVPAGVAVAGVRREFGRALDRFHATTGIQPADIDVTLRVVPGAKRSRVV